MNWILKYFRAWHIFSWNHWASAALSILNLLCLQVALRWVIQNGVSMAVASSTEAHMVEDRLCHVGAG